MPIIEGLQQRLALNQSSRSPLLEKLSGGKLRLDAGGTAHVACCLFKGTPAAATLADDANVTAAHLLVRKHTPQGTLLLNKNSGAIDTSVTWSDWDSDLDEMWTFDLTTTDTNVAVWDSGRLPFYWCVLVTTATSSYVAGFGFGEFVGFGITNATPTPTPDPAVAGIFSHSKVIAGADIGATTIAMSFTPALAIAPTYIGRPVFRKSDPSEDNIDPISWDSATAFGYNVNLSAGAIAGQVLQNSYIP